MSDGNFNRSMLPYNNYQSGTRAGRAQMKHIAQDSFRQWVLQKYPDATPEVVENYCREFKAIMDAR